MNKREFFRSIQDNGYFLDEKNIQKLVEIDCHCLVLVRCGSGRFLTPAQNVEHFVNIITRDGFDYVRDVSVPVDVLAKEQLKNG
jgi:hypothetical protein